MVLSFLLAALLAIQGAGQDADMARYVERANGIVDQLMADEVEPVAAMFNDRMKAAVTVEQLRGGLASARLQAGPFKARVDARGQMRGAMHAVVVTCEFERNNVEVAVAFDEADKIAGLSIRPATTTTEPYATPAYVTPSAFTDVPVTVDAGGWPLPGLISMPLGDGQFPAVVLVHGSGPGDRDESVGPNKPFRDLAWGLASRGIAVLRYDKRTRVHAQRAQALKEVTVKDETIDDALAAVAVLRATPKVRGDRVFVLGHSLGGMLAPRIGAADPKLAGLVAMAGAVRPLEDSIVSQTRYLAELDGQVTDIERSQLEEFERMAARIKALKPGDPPISTPPFGAPASYFIDLNGYNPPAAAASLKVPMLVLQGERDYQVTMEDFAAWQKALAGHPGTVLKSYPSLNHLFMAGSGKPNPGEYQTAGHIAEAVVADIASWIKEK